MLRGLGNALDDFFLRVWPRIGASSATGLPGGKAEDAPLWFVVSRFPLATAILAGLGDFMSAWLYIHVAASTVELPTTNARVIRKSNSATLARKLITMDKLVAKPFMMLSEYLMTMAVIKPPNT
ncbi:hypothetical protein RSAG8_00258, partial [Rhizoctonia solani AG-8 WAC10335]